MCKLIKWGIDEKGNGTSAPALSGFKITDEKELRWAISPFLQDEILQDGYTVFKLNILTSFKSYYSLVLYEFIQQWKQRKWIEFSIEEFRILMGIEDKQYRYMADFKKKVLTPALKEINEKSDLKVFCNDKKKGVKITGFRFEFTVLTAEEIKEREKHLIDTEYCIKALKDSFGNRYRIGGKWFVLKKEGLVHCGRVLYDLIEAVEKIHKMKTEGLLHEDDIQELKKKL